jgi:hypothetical protein
MSGFTAAAHATVQPNCSSCATVEKQFHVSFGARVGRSRGRSVAELYNSLHPHKALGYRSPREFIAD